MNLDSPFLNQYPVTTYVSNGLKKISIVKYIETIYILKVPRHLVTMKTHTPEAAMIQKTINERQKRFKTNEKLAMKMYKKAKMEHMKKMKQMKKEMVRADKKKRAGKTTTKRRKKTTTKRKKTTTKRKTGVKRKTHRRRKAKA